MSGSNFTEGVENTLPSAAPGGKKKPSAFRVNQRNDAILRGINLGDQTA